MPRTGGSPSAGPTVEPPTPAATVPNEGSTTLRKRLDRNGLKDHWGNITGRTLQWLNQGTRLEDMLAETKLKDIAIVLGIATEKTLLLEGQPTQIIGQPQQAKLDQLGQALQTALKQRGLVKLTERTATIDLNGAGPTQ